jgi:hypothetical protein
LPAAFLTRKDYDEVKHLLNICNINGAENKEQNDEKQVHKLSLRIMPMARDRQLLV